MKKSKLSITLVTGFIAAMAMTACDSVTASKKAIVTFTPYGSDEKIALITDDVYNAYRGTTSGITKFYDKILEVLIRYEFKENNFDKGEMKYSEIENWAKNQVKEQKDKARTEAKNNEDKTYDEAWKDILEANNVENEKGLLEKFIYEKEKEVIKNWYADNAENAASLKEEFLGVKADGTAVVSDVKAAMPYHVRHILVKVDEASDAAKKFYKGTVNETQAKLLYDTASTLAEGKFTFSEVAKTYSEDSSNVNGGDVGIMTNDASSGNLTMVNEFQLGIYAYDSLYNAANKTSPAADIIKNGLGITDEVANALPAEITEVPYEAFVNMGAYSEITADKEGNSLADGSEALFPRNIVWNKYFNLHGVFVIKNAKKAPYTGLVNPEEEFAYDKLADTTPFDATLPRFNNDGYLTDERGNVIIGVRSQHGIHFMVIEKSVFEYQDLATYYDTKLPGDTGYNADSYVGFIQSGKLEDYKKRADDVKNAISNFDKTYDYRLYQYLTSKVSISFNGAAEGLDEDIDNLIGKTKAQNAYNQEDGLFKSWRSYTELLEKQTSDRSVWYTTINKVTGALSPKLTRLVPEKIADDFFKLYEDPSALGAAALYAEFDKGGNYYYYA